MLVAEVSRATYTYKSPLPSSYGITCSDLAGKEKSYLLSSTLLSCGIADIVLDGKWIMEVCFKDLYRIFLKKEEEEEKERHSSLNHLS